MTKSDKESDAIHGNSPMSANVKTSSLMPVRRRAARLKSGPGSQPNV
jgi:hypothetical protein